MLIVIWIFGAVVIGAIAGGKGRSGFGWFVLSLCISALLAGLLLALVGNAPAPSEQTQLEGGTVKKCPMCAEIVKAEAIVCKHCGARFAVAE